MLAQSMSSSLTIMMRLVFFVIIAGTVTTASNFDRVDELLQAFIKKSRTPGLVAAVIVNGQPEFTRTYGSRDHSDEKSHVTTNSLFEIGSCTKAFTTYLMALLVREGMVAYDDPVIDHIPEFRLSDPEITRNIHVQDLISHASGLPGHDDVWYHSNASRDDLLKIIPHLKLSYGLREKYQYNNIMYTMAGIVTERVTKHSWEHGIRARIFEPLNMTQSLTSFAEAEELPGNADVAKGHTTKRNGQRIVLLPPNDVTMIAPAGSIHSSLNDMVKWAQFQISETVPQEMHVLKTPQNYDPPTIYNSPGNRQYFGYALGWSITIHRGQYVITHSGQTDGFCTCVVLIPENKRAYVVMLNLDTVCLPLFVLIKRMDDIMANITLTESDEVWLSKILGGSDQQSNYTFSEKGVDQPEQYVGNYHHPGYGNIKISVVKSELLLTYNNIPNILKPLKNEEEHFIIFPQINARTDGAKDNKGGYFVRDYSGDVVECRIGFEPAVSSIVFKKLFSGENDLKYLGSFVGTFKSGSTSVQIVLNRKAHLLVAILPGYNPEKLKPLKRNWFSFNHSPLLFEFIFANETISEFQVYQGVELLGIFKKDM